MNELSSIVLLLFLNMWLVVFNLEFIFTRYIFFTYDTICNFIFLIFICKYSIMFFYVRLCYPIFIQFYFTYFLYRRFLNLQKKVPIHEMINYSWNRDKLIASFKHEIPYFLHLRFLKIQVIDTREGIAQNTPKNWCRTHNTFHFISDKIIYKIR